MALIRIYQSYHLPEQRAALDPAFVPLDNTANFLPELREFPLIRQVHSRQIWDQVDLTGVFSWKWSQKTRGWSGARVQEWILSRPGAAAYFFNPWGNDLGYIYNTWELAEWCHPGIMRTLSWLWPRLGWAPEQLWEPHAVNHMTWCNFIVATPEFWSAWLAQVQCYLEQIPHMPAEIQQQHAEANYQGLSHFPFIQERMATALAHARPDLRTETCQVSSTGQSPQRLLQARDRAQKLRTREAWHEWRKLRNGLLSEHRRVLPQVQDLAEKWIESARFD
jgi:hypothetical protein